MAGHKLTVNFQILLIRAPSITFGSTHNMVTSQFSIVLQAMQDVGIKRTSLMNCALTMRDLVTIYAHMEPQNMILVIVAFSKRTCVSVWIRFMTEERVCVMRFDHDHC